jgi:hypothetical protein
MATYEIFKHFFLKNETNLAALTRLYNYSLSTGLFPSNASNGIVTLLPKDNQWNGVLKETRPITLLETYRKVYETIINKRIQRIIYGNNLLKGNTFAFRRVWGQPK